MPYGQRLKMNNYPCSWFSTKILFQNYNFCIKRLTISIKIVPFLDEFIFKKENKIVNNFFEKYAF
tara:strand:+ start:56 stop:250 length:195 start_codon:yes stop_codon:yes gene_type:complete